MTLRDIENNIADLTKAKTEKIEYKVRINGEYEDRANTIPTASLYAQLKNFAQHAPNTPKAERTPPNKPSSRPPGNMAGFLLLDEIASEAAYWTDRALIESGRDRENALNPMPNLLHVLTRELRHIEDAHPDVIDQVTTVTRGWVKRARHLLGHEQPQTMLTDHVCGECGGGLIVATDASTAVRCIGTPDTPSCGTTYTQDMWLQLLDAQ
ncbi:DUF7341 domain-containing protein [Streptomyces sp. NPDC001774]